MGRSWGCFSLAETDSVFGEVIRIDRALRNSVTIDRGQAYIIVHFIHFYSAEVVK